jgi:diacylglycerol kinase (ATP)
LLRQEKGERAPTSKELFGYKPDVIRFEVDGKTHEEKIFMLSVANGPQFGNNVFINPLANVFDGKLNLTVIRPFSRLRIAPILTSMRLGRTHRIREFTQYTGTRFKVQPSNTWAHIDGEPVEINGEQTIEIVPQSLKILC